jgi:hypothetical protein
VLARGALERLQSLCANLIQRLAKSGDVLVRVFMSATQFLQPLLGGGE